MPKPVRERLTVGQPCEARGQGLYSKPERGVIAEVLPRGYLVKLDGYIESAPPKRFPEKKVTAIYARKPTPKLLPLAVEDLSVDVEAKTFEVPRFQDADRLLKPIAKPHPPKRSPAYLAWVRQQPCCNCDAPGPSDPDHVGKRGVGQRVSDFACIPLCRWCHRGRTDFNRLPAPTLAKRGSALTDRVCRTVVATEEIVAGAQRDTLRNALRRVLFGCATDLYQRMLESISEEELQDLLKVNPYP